MEKGVNMDHALHITRRPMSSFSFCNRGHPKAWTGSCSSDPMSTRLLKSLLGSGGDGVRVPLGIERKGHMWIVTDLTILRSHHLFWVIFFYTKQPPDLHLAPRWISMMGGKCFSQVMWAGFPPAAGRGALATSVSVSLSGVGWHGLVHRVPPS